MATSETERSRSLTDPATLPLFPDLLTRARGHQRAVLELRAVGGQWAQDAELRLVLELLDAVARDAILATTLALERFR